MKKHGCMEREKKANQKYNRTYIFIASYLYWQYLACEFKK